MEILLAEDSLTSARMTMSALKSGAVQHRLTWLTDGSETLQFLRRQGKYAQAPSPDLILLDLGLPIVDGREVLTEIRSDEELRQIPVVVLTGSTLQEDQIRSEQLNVEGYLTKPVNIKKFLKLVRELANYWHADMIGPATGN
jgi:CheY-like chemotaxis protein